MRVLIVDPHPMTRDGLRAALRSGGIGIAGEASTGEEAIKAASETCPDVVVMEVALSGISGIEATHALHEACPDAKVVLLTSDESRESVSGAIRAGISGYLLKDSTAEEILGAVGLAVEGKAVLHPRITQVFIEEAKFAGDNGHKGALSPREMEVLHRLAHGATTKRAAEELGISPHTVKTHLERVFEKLGATSRAEAVAIGLRQGLVD